MSEGFSTTSTSGSTYPSAPLESHPADYGVTPTGNGAESSTTGAAKQQAGEVAQTAKESATQVAGTVKEQAGAVKAEVGNQARQLFDQARTEVSDQAATQQQRVAGGLHSLADEVQSLLNGQPKEGVASDVARMASDKAHEIADWLDRRDPASLVEEVKSFARRRPGAYLAIALGAGIIAGRLAKGLTASNSNTQQVTGGRSTYPPRPVVGDTGYGAVGTAGYAASYGQDDALLMGSDVPAVQAIPPVEGYGTTGYDATGTTGYGTSGYGTTTGGVGGTQGDLTR